MQLGQNESLNLPFVPVSTMQLAVFLDGDRNGVRDANEPLIPGTAVLLDGPVTRRVFTSQDGNVWISGLPEGTYQASVDFASLPAGFELTADVAPVRVSPPANAGPLFIPVAPRIRDVVTTFTAGSLAVVAHTSQSTVRVGRQLEVWANVTGDPATVSVELFGQRFEMENDGTRWIAIMTVPANAGLQRGVVEAVNGTDSARADIQVLVTAPD